MRKDLCVGHDEIMDLRGDLPYARHFSLSITKALGDQLFAAMDEMELVPLTSGNIETVKELPGVYELHQEIKAGDRSEKRWVYVGKAKDSLRTRLRQHLRKLSGRMNISQGEMYFKCAYVDEDFSSSAPEAMLIDRLKRRDRATGAVGYIWNGNGFGGKDPGVERDTTKIKSKHFDYKYPANILLEYSVEDVGAVIIPGEGGNAAKLSVVNLVTKLKELLPYNLRVYEGFHSEASDKYVSMNFAPSESIPVDRWLTLVADALDPGWQITLLPGYLIMYPNARDYASARRYWRSSQGHAEVLDGDMAGEIPVR